MSDWYKLSPEQVLAQLKVDPERGLEDSEAKNRLEQHGRNELTERGVKSPWRIFLEQFTGTMVVVLMIAALISALLGEFQDAIIVMVIVILNALLGFRQEYQAEQAMAALKKLAIPTVRVKRGGHIKEISSVTLVPGDIVLLEAGNLVPADCLILESANLSVQEAALTGESEPVNKIMHLASEGTNLQTQDLSLGDRRNILYMGTVVTYGRGQGIVTDTGMNTELGSIAELMQTAGQEPTPLQRRLTQLGKGLALAALILVGIVFIIGLIRGEEIKLLFLTSISIAVAAIPEGLPAVVTIALALGAKRMLKRNALIRKLPAVEALGSVTVICSDKTGTLTENRMTVTVLDVANNRIDLTGEEVNLPLRDRYTLCIGTEPTPEQQAALRSSPALTLLLVGGALCNDAILECEEGGERYKIIGDPTEGALAVAAARIGLSKEILEVYFPRKAEVPFDSERKRMTTIHSLPISPDKLPSSLQNVWDWNQWAISGQSNSIAFMKGASDNLLEISNQVWVVDHIESLGVDWRSRIEAANASLANQGMRVLGVAFRIMEHDTDKGDEDIRESRGAKAEDIEEDLVFVGLLGMIDPARPEVKKAINTCRLAGIRPVMITGDHPLTAAFIAQELELKGESEVITGQELEGRSDQELEEMVLSTSVYARVSPEHKLRIVQALQAKKQLVAMTGDGVNDAPALRKADIGVAMGITGTDVSKEASDMVLLDDNFATIVAAVQEGRIIYDNIRKFIQYTLTSNTGEILAVLLAPFLGMPLPLLPIQILWINLVTDGLPGLALGVEIGERDTMRRPPYPPKENVFARGLAANVIWIGMLMGLISLTIGFLFWRIDSPYWQTMVFSTLTLSEMGYVMAIRSSRESLFSIGIFSNKSLLGAVALTTLLQFAVIYIPFLQSVFKTTALPLRELSICLALSTSLFVVVEVQKWLIRRKKKYMINV